MDWYYERLFPGPVFVDDINYSQVQVADVLETANADSNNSPTDNDNLIPDNVRMYCFKIH